MIKCLEELFTKCNHEGIRYVHWKSNEHLGAALNGETDLDILVHKDDYNYFISLLLQQGFTLYQAVKRQSYISVSDYLYLDAFSGRFIHVHLHRLFIAGAKYFKEYCIPIEIHLLNARVMSEWPMVYTTDASQELFLLWYRYCLKNTLPRFLLKGMKISKDYIRESNWLYQRADRDKVLAFCHVLTGSDHFFHLLMRHLARASPKNFIEMLRSAHKSAHIYKTKRMVGMRYFFVRAMMVLNYIKQKILRLPTPYRRVNPNGGVVVAIIGADGAGKSTVNHALFSSLSSKIDVYQEYLGSGDGRSSIMRGPIVFLKKIRDKHKKNISKGALASQSKKIGLARFLWATTLAFEKKAKLHRVWKARARGMLVICDRYPQTQRVGINDGPMLQSWHGSEKAWKRRCAAWEWEIYKQAERLFPDLVIKLMVDLQTAIQRKPYEDVAVVAEKIQIIESLAIPCGKMVQVNAALPLEEMLFIVYKEVSAVI